MHTRRLTHQHHSVPRQKQTSITRTSTFRKRPQTPSGDDGERCGEHAGMRMVTRKTSDAKRDQVEVLAWLAQSP